VNTFDSHKTNGDGRDAEQVFDLIELPPKELEAAWHQFSTNHIRPSRLLRLTVMLYRSPLFVSFLQILTLMKRDPLFRFSDPLTR
jgi:hypothetical protein